MTELMIYFLIGFVFLMIAPILIGVVVYLDAVKRKLTSPWKWALIAALIPLYIGLLIYFLIGINQTDSGKQS